MKIWTLYNAKLGSCRRLTEQQMLEAKKFYGIDFPIWDEYYQKFDENSLSNSRQDIFLWAREEPITLELKRYGESEYTLGGVVKITDNTEYGKGHFAIFIFDRRVFFANDFEFVRCKETGEYFVKDGIWNYKSELKAEESEDTEISKEITEGGE